jgi:hypothetical protein
VDASQPTTLRVPKSAAAGRAIGALWAIVSSPRTLPYIAAVLAGFVAYFASHGRSTPYNNYVLLADALRHGRLWIDWPGDAVSDALLWNGQRYVIEAPVPALLMLPFVAIFGPQFNQTTAAIVLCSIAVGFACAFLQRLGARGLSLGLLLLFTFAGTDLWWCAELGDVWFIAHVSAVCFTFIALWELTGKSRGWLVGLCAIGAIESRFSLVVTLPFYLAAVACGGLAFPRTFRWSRLRIFGGLVAVTVVLAIAYNYARWGLPYDIGYDTFYNRDSWGQPTGSPFRLEYVPYELYSFFMRPPTYVEYRQLAQWPIFNIDHNGVALTWTSPALLLAFFAKGKRTTILALWGVTILAAIPDMCYYLNGWYQFGMRHALDFEPFLIALMAMASIPKMPRWAMWLCVYSALAGLWGVWWWNANMRQGA